MQGVNLERGAERVQGRVGARGGQGEGHGGDQLSSMTEQVPDWT